MASRSRRWVWLGCVGIIACGARTGSDLVEPAGGGGAPFGGTGNVGIGGSTGGIWTGGYGGTGGIGGIGGSCTSPTCNCNDCTSMCVCTGTDPSTCNMLCGSGGVGGIATGGAGGYPSGGYPSGGGPATGGFGTGGVAGGSGYCCTPSPGPGCFPQPTQECVCKTDGYCCSTAWDAKCVREVDTLHCGSCGSGGSGGVGTGGFGTGGVATGGFGAIGGVGGSGGVATGGFGAIGGSGGTGTGGVATGGFGAIGGIGGSGGSGGSIGLCTPPPNACSKCLCSSCGADLDVCLSNVGCPVILECMGRTSCFGFGCYRTSTCKDVIDAFGGFFGNSNIEATTLIVCAFGAGCSC